MFEENDCMEGKSAIDAEWRAMSTKTVAVGDDISSLRNELRQLHEQMAAMFTTKAVMQTTIIAPNLATSATCPYLPHRGECYGEAIATGKLTLEQAAEKFTFISDPARRPAAAAAALERYQDH
eukprot:6213845-Pleurochrysis_carterae.AAC.3